MKVILLRNKYQKKFFFAQQQNCGKFEGETKLWPHVREFGPQIPGNFTCGILTPGNFACGIQSPGNFA